MTSSNGNIFRVTGHLCGEFTGPRWIPHTKASDAGLWYFFDVRPNKQLSKQSWGWWFETLSSSIWRHRNDRTYSFLGCLMVTSSNGNILRATGPLRGEFTGHWWIPLTRASDAELWCFLWSAPGKRLKNIETPVIWYAIVLIMTSL